MGNFLKLEINNEKFVDFNLMKNLLILICGALSVELYAMDYCDEQCVHESHLRQNALLNKVLPVSRAKSLSSKNCVQSELSKKMYDLNARTALLWSIFADCVIDDEVFYLPFDVKANIRYNKQKLDKENNFDGYLTLKCQIDYLMYIFYSYQKTSKEFCEFKGVRKREEARSLLSNWFFKNCRIPLKAGTVS